MDAHERRQRLLERLCRERHDTYKNLAQLFGVSKRTIQNDIMVLTGSYPIETVCGRYGGGIRLMDGYHLDPKRLTADETNLLKRLATTLSRLLGHANPSITLDKYGHAMDDHKRLSVERLEGVYLDGHSKAVPQAITENTSTEFSWDMSMHL